MKNETNRTIQCPYCGTGNEYDTKVCVKCGNRIPESTRDRGVDSLNHRVIRKDNRKTLMPLRRRNDEAVVEEPLEEKPVETRNIPEERIVSFREEERENTISKPDAIVGLRYEEKRTEPIAIRTPQIDKEVQVERKPLIDDDESAIISLEDLERRNAPVTDVKTDEEKPEIDEVEKTDEVVEEPVEETTEVAMDDEEILEEEEDLILEEEEEIDEDSQDESDEEEPQEDEDEDEDDDEESEEDYEYSLTEGKEEYTSFDYDATSEEIDLDEDEPIENDWSIQKEESQDLDDEFDYASYHEDEYFEDEDEDEDDEEGEVPSEFVDDVTVLLSDTIETIKQEITPQDQKFPSDFELNPSWDEKAEKINIPLYIIRATLKPFNKYKKEEDKLGDLRNVIFLAGALIVAMAIFGTLKTMLETIRVTSFWTGEVTWVWENLKDLQYFKEIVTNILIYTGVVVGLSTIYYGASQMLKKEVKFVKLLSAVTTAFIPFVLAYGLLSTGLSLIYEPLAIVATVVGLVYSVIILMEIINDIIKVEDVNNRIYFHMVCLALFFVIIVIIEYKSGLNIIKEEIGFLSSLL